MTILVVAAGAFICMIGLGNWQVARLAWKLDLIERVEAYAFGEPAYVTAQSGPPEYLRVKLSGTYDHDHALRVKAVTDLGMGHWWLVPLETQSGAIWVNRGFVPSGTNWEELARPTGTQNITGLVRDSASGGTLLETNDPASGRWVSVDLAAMSRVADIEAAGFYVAADHPDSTQVWPRGGLTKVQFRNTHLSYALTWYAMAILFFGAMVFVIWDRRRTTMQNT